MLATYHDVDKVLPTTDQHHSSTFSSVDGAKVFRRTKTGDYRLEPGLLLFDRYAIEASIRPSHSDSQENAVDFNPNNAQAQTALGSAYFLQVRLDEAIE